MDSLGPNDRWKVTGVIGAGGFSTVYSAIDTRFESPVAIKVLADNMSTNLDIRERFLSEALLLRSNPGPVVPVYDTGETKGGQPFLVMPLADGGDLRTRIEQWRQVAIPTADDIMHLAETLTHVLAGLHERGVVHRDLKPSNLLIFGAKQAAPQAETRIAGSLIARGETVLLSDLGFAKDLVKNSGLTVGGGTPGYTPPEQRQAGRVDHRADIWGASAIMYWFLVGHPPPESKELRRVGLQPVATPLLIDAIEIGLSDNPVNRPNSVVSWYRSIDTAVRQSLMAAEQRSRFTQSKLALAGLAVAGLICVGGLGFWVAAATQGDGSDNDARTTVDGDLTTSTADIGGAAVSITGPAEIELGSTVSYTAIIDPDISDWVWISPAGSMHQQTSSLPLEATNVGRGEVALIATTSTGERLRVAIEIQVVP